MVRKSQEAQASSEDLNLLLGEEVTQVCLSLDKKIAIPFATALSGLTGNEAMSALLGYRPLPVEAMALLTGNAAAKQNALQVKAQELMARRRAKIMNKKAAGNMAPVLAHFHEQLTIRGLPTDVHTALASHPDPYKAMGALVLGNGPVPQEIQTAYRATGAQRPNVLQAARASWHAAISQQA